MITSVCLNPVLDKIYVLNELIVGGVNRPKKITDVPAGKGVNVAKVASLLGGNIMASGFLPAEGGKLLSNMLNEHEIPFEFVHVPGKLRLSMKIVDKSKSSVTEVIENGTPIDKGSSKKMYSLIAQLAKDSSYMVFSGSLPKGLTSDYYALLIESIKEAGVKVILDTSGKPLKNGINAAPFMIKPNINEMQELMGQDIKTEKDIIRASRSLLNNGIEIVLVSLGSEGAILCKRNCVYRVASPEIDPVNTVGCGDSLVAGFIVSLDEGKSICEALVAGTAAACANALDNEVGSLKIRDYEQLKKKIVVEKRLAPSF